MAEPDVVAHACDPSTWEAEASGLGIQSQSWPWLNEILSQNQTR